MFMDSAGQRCVQDLCGVSQFGDELQIDVVLGCPRKDYGTWIVSRCVCFVTKPYCFVLKRRSKGSP